jgi:hypothetical protein
MAPKVLFLTLSSYGQVNCHLAVAYVLIQSGVEVHLASFEIRKKTAAHISKMALQTAPEGTRPIKFHRIEGAHAEFDEEAIPFPEFMTTGRLSFWGSLRNIYWMSQGITSQWPEDNLVQIYQSCLRIIKEVGPDTVAVDVLLGPALVACQHSSFKYQYMLLSPMAAKEFFGPA